MTDHIILTVRSQKNNFDVDMELPSKISIADLAPQLLENLKAIAPHQFMGVEEIRLRCGNYTLKQNDTLDSAYVYDGAILEVI